MHEFELIAMVQQRFSRPSPGVELGIGDDAAVVAAGGGRRWVFTTDAVMEGVHFDRSYGTAHQLGRKALAINLSDLAAMGADPRYALIALACPEELEAPYLEELFAGLDELGREHRVSIIGGNVSRAPCLSLTITAIGDLSGPPLVRSGANPGDRLFVTGELGSAALGLELLRGALNVSNQDDEGAPFIERQLDPRPRVAVGQALRLMATAGLDISDGLVQDAGHMATASGCSLRIERDRLPLAPAYHRLAQALPDPWAPALNGGEDYELLLTIPPTLAQTAQLTANQVGAELHEIGEVTGGSGVVVVDETGAPVIAPPGWQHL
jgi:thiamine-monophosphate kinase